MRKYIVHAQKCPGARHRGASSGAYE